MGALTVRAVLIVALAALAVVAVAIVALDRLHASQAAERDVWAQERRSLLDRIQHPEVLQAPPPPLEPAAAPPIDESAWAGTSRSVDRDA